MLLVVFTLFVTCIAQCPGNKYVNPPEAQRRYQGTLNNEPARSMLDSSFAWCTLAGLVNPWMTMDLTNDMMVVGMIVQGRQDHAPHHVKTYEVQYSDDGVTYVSSGTYTANNIQSQNAKSEVSLVSQNHHKDVE